jgi:osmoprotectant transport system substrate-binding protein
MQLGQRRDYLAALDTDTVTLVGDDSGDLLAALDSGSVARKPEEVIEAVNRALPEGLVVSDPADGTDLRPAVVLAKQRTDRYPDTLKELAPRCGELTVGITTGPGTDPLRPLLDPRRDVVDPLREVYGCIVTRYTTFAADTDVRKALLDSTIQAGVLAAPPSFLPGGAEDLVALSDSAYAFRAQNTLPLFRKGILTDRQIRKLNYVAGELTTAELADMVRHLRDEHASAPDLARIWLDAHAL